jgi:hypothetical protein
MNYEITNDGKLNLVRKFLEERQGLAELLVGDEPRFVESVGITLFGVHPHTRSEEVAGLHILCGVYVSAESRGDLRACTRLRAFYDLLAKEYRLPNEIDAILEMRKRREKEKQEELERQKAIAAGQAPSPSAAPSPKAARPSAQRGTTQAS